MTLGEVWNDHTFRMLVEDFCKARKKGDDLAVMRLRIMIDYLNEKTGQPVKKKPEAAEEIEVDEEEEEPEEEGEEEPPLKPWERIEPVKTPQNDRMSELKRRLLAQKGPSFQLIFDQRWEADKIQNMINAMGLPFQIPAEGIKRPGLGAQGQLLALDGKNFDKADIPTNERGKFASPDDWLVSFVRVG